MAVQQEKPGWVTEMEKARAAQKAASTPASNDVTQSNGSIRSYSPSGTSYVEYSPGTNISYGVAPTGTPTKTVDGVTYYQYGNTWAKVDPRVPNQAQISQMTSQLQQTGTVSDAYKERFGLSSAPSYNTFSAPNDQQGFQEWVSAGGMQQATGRQPNENVSAIKLSSGKYLDTTNLTPQQTFAAQLWDQVEAGRRQAQEVMNILASMGLDRHGNQALPTGNAYSISGPVSTPSIANKDTAAPSAGPSLLNTPNTGVSSQVLASALPAGAATQTAGGVGTGPARTTPVTPTAGAGSAASTTQYEPTPNPTESQQRARAWIENPASGFGNLNQYIQNNIERYRRGEISYNALKADAERVGYSIPPLVGETVTQTPTLPDYSWITDMVNAELEQQQQAIQQELARLQQANELAVQQNNLYLQEAIRDLERNRIQAGAEVTNFQNRRGGFYSGGLDYQLGTINQAFAEAQENVTRDIAARNADIWNRNALLAQQAAEKLSLLQQQVPQRIQQLIREQMERDRQFALQEAGLTGMYQGQPTLAARNMEFEQNLAQQQFGLQQRAQQLNEIQMMAQLTGYLPDGTPTTAEQQRQLQNEWALAESIGRITPTLAAIYGIPENTPTLQAKQIAIAQQNANTSAYSAQTARMNAELDRQRYAQQQDINAMQAQILDGIAKFDNADDASAWLNQNAKTITENLGADTFVEIKRMIPLFFGSNEDTSSKDAQRIRQQAVEMAMKDVRWNYKSTDKAALIQEYINYLGG